MGKTICMDPNIITLYVVNTLFLSATSHSSRTQKEFQCICLIVNGKRKAVKMHEKHLNGNNDNKKKREKKLACTYYNIFVAKSLIK